MQEDEIIRLAMLNSIFDTYLSVHNSSEMIDELLSKIDHYIELLTYAKR